MLDGVGAGALPDAGDYGDVGSDTLGNLSRVVDLSLPFLEKLGLGTIIPVRGVPPVPTPLAMPGRLAVVSAGKDTTVGHWEHMGLVTAQPFPTYPDGFPQDVVGPFMNAIGRGILGNRTASGTAIIDELGAAHLATGEPIVYTSADSVFQIAAHVEVVPLEQLYAWCETARAILQGRHAVARVIARPFTGRPGHFVRTKDRRDYSLAPPGPTYLDLLEEAGIPVVALGKIGEVFLGRGISAEIKVATNDENLALVRDLLRHRNDRERFDRGLLFTNLVDFDMVWGHRNDVDGLAEGLVALDRALPSICAALRPNDALIISADHGTDPTTPSTDHSREHVPLLLYPRPSACPAAVYQGTLADTGATVYHWLTGRPPALGGDVLTDCRPSRGWRRHTAAQPCPGRPSVLVPGRVGQQEALEAASYLQKTLGDAPRVAVILGSGLSAALSTAPTTAPSGTPSVVPPGAPAGEQHRILGYADIPHWAQGEVAGHPYRLVLAGWGGRQLVLLEGRIHGYEGYDLSELQLPVRTLAQWGVRSVLLTSSSGAVAVERKAGDVVIVTTVIDCQSPLLRDGAGSGPERLAATEPAVVERVISALEHASWLSAGAHAAVPGPQYETDAELRLLRSLGAETVSMSLAFELLAAHEVGLEVAALSLVVNAGHTSHGGVLAGAEDAAAAFSSAVAATLACWGP
jgi:phosphopentomutase